MRHIGTLDSAQEANRFTAYLIVAQIRAMVEQEGEKFAIWIREENDLPKAKEEFSAFLANPSDPRYSGKEREAEALLRAERDGRLKGQKNIVQVQQKAPGSSPVSMRRSPLCMTLLGISVIVTLLFFSEQDQPREGRSFVESLFFTDNAGRAAFNLAGENTELRAKAAFSAIARGEVWRLVTPIFIHLSWVHLIFNCWALLILGSRLENRFGAMRLALWMLAIAIFSNAAQAILEGPGFGGLSGVLYGVVGIAVVYSMRSGGRSILITREETVIYMIWFVLCIVLSSDQWGEVMGNKMLVANVAHGAGLFFGAAIGLVVSFWNRPAK
jgi:GlpG protein